jgi:hypothetical protein
MASSPIASTTATLTLFVVLGGLGAFDTLYYHEWRAKLPAMGPLARSELQLHALRDFVYAILFSMLPWLAWQGRYVVALITLLVVEIILTLWDFVVEDWIRKPLGGVYPGERVMHGLMGIVYGAALAYLVPVLRVWWSRPTSLTIASPANSLVLAWILMVMGIGVLLSGIRDLCAAVGMPGSAWPWIGKESVIAKNK